MTDRLALANSGAKTQVLLFLDRSWVRYLACISVYLATYTYEKRHGYVPRQSKHTLGREETGVVFLIYKEFS